MYNLVSKFGLYTILGVTVFVLVIAGISYQSSNNVDLLLNLGYVLIYAAIGAAVILPLINSLKDPKVLLRAGIGVGALGTIFGITYSRASSEFTPVYEKLENVTSADIQLAGGLVQMTIILIIIAVVAVILGELSKAIR